MKLQKLGFIPALALVGAFALVTHSASAATKCTKKDFCMVGSSKIYCSYYNYYNNQCSCQELMADCACQLVVQDPGDPGVGS